MNERLEQLLIECLDALDAGDPVEQILAWHEGDIIELRPLLEAAIAMTQLDSAPRPTAQAEARRRFLERAAELQPQRRIRLLSARLTAALSGAVLVLTFGGSVVLASGSLPGDALYGVKRTVEQVRLSIASDPSHVRAELEGERRAEVRRLIAAGRAEAVSFSGMIEQIDPGRIVVDGLSIVLGSDTVMNDSPRIGSRASVTGQVTDGVVYAERVVIEPGEQSEPHVVTPAPTSTPTSQLIPTTNTVLPTKTPTATTLPTAVPTQAPVLNHNPPPPTTAPQATAMPNTNENTNDNSGPGGDDTNKNTNDDNGGNSGPGGENGGDDNADENTNDDNGGSGPGGGDNANENTNDDSGGNSDPDDDDNGDNSGPGGGDDNGSGDD